MKTILSFILVSSLSFGCKICPPSSVDPVFPVLLFTIMDKDGNDLFFGENSTYDPQSVKITTEQGEPYEFKVDDRWGECFALWISQGKTSIFYVEFIPNRTDTIKVESHFVRWYEETKGCRLWEIYNNDIFFNGISICKSVCLESLINIDIKL